MGCFTIVGYIFAFIFCFSMALASWGSGDHAASVVLFLIAFVGIPVMFSKSELYAKWNEDSLKKKRTSAMKRPQSNAIEFVVTSNCKYVQDDEMDDDMQKDFLTLKTEAVLKERDGSRYSGIKSISYSGEEFDLTYHDEQETMRSALYQFLTTYMNLRDVHDLFFLEKEYPRYLQLKSYFPYIKRRKDFDVIYRKAKEDFREYQGMPFPRFLSNAVNNPSDFELDLNDICCRLAEEYKDYWISVLKGYKRVSAFEKRKEYLIENIDKVCSLNCMKGNDKAVNFLREFQKELPAFVQ